ncbi:hypothetical protein BDN72DRAFT_963186 [Pluteus cervinus]|uniref:Uncharacterized protein n=1 Tax=Pluteus cervinus TaxID=181527 RepID=A0ACD3AGG1_9AGAR|nr:hypothetical protein BDN72DRAFT_963186 [Pluteus cervinus]
MSHFRRLFALISLAATVSAAVLVQRGPVTPNSILSADPSTIAASSNNTPVDLSTANPTDSDAIAATVQQVDQKTGPTDSALPSSDVPPTVITAVDGDVTEAGQGSGSLLGVLHDPNSHPDLDTGSTVSKRDIPLEKRGDYEQVFYGTGTGLDDRDASIEGTAYLTFTRLDSFDDGACKAFCDGIDGCVFVNMFYHFNSDPVYNPQIKCAAYGDIHTAAEKTNFGDQQLLPLPAGKTYVQQSVGYAADSLADPPIPDGYEFVFLPTNGANNAPGYMGFALLDKYDVQACANLCNTRGADANGGACQYFNIWRALVNGNPTTYSCVMYYLPTDASTATNTGQGDLQVTYSRGYRRTSYLPDGGFEGYECPSGVCYTESYTNWIGTSPAGGAQDASIFDYVPYARTGHSSGLLGSGSAEDDFSGTLAPAAPLSTVAGKDYWITFFQDSTFSGPSDEAAAFIDVKWNGVTVLSITPGYQAWGYYEVKVTAVGNDQLEFYGGTAPAWSFLDDIYVWLA